MLNKYNERKNKGFTLVELSIVLVIIGLLIGGILVAQSMIETAKISAFVRQLQQYDIAAMNFKEKYRSLPGDSTVFSNVGDGDGYVENSEVNNGSFAHSGRVQDYEIAVYWPQLQQDGLVNTGGTTFTSNFASGIKTGVNVPKAVAGTSGTGFAIFATTEPRTYYYVCDWSTSTGQSYDPSSQRKAAFKPSTALAIDLKIDDGSAGRGGGVQNGSMIVDNWNNSYGVTNNGRCFTAADGNKYSVSNNTEECCLTIRLLSSTGIGK